MSDPQSRLSESPEQRPSRSRGPPRRKHHKSKTGCQTCKRRHIRCDETPGQCQNCSRHHVHCDYATAVEATASEASPTPPMLENVPMSNPDLASSFSSSEVALPVQPPMMETIDQYMGLTSVSIPPASYSDNSSEPIATGYPSSSIPPMTSVSYPQSQSPFQYSSSNPGDSTRSLVPGKLLPILIQWQQTGISPYAEIPFQFSEFWSLLTLPELRMIYHISGISIALHRQGLENSSVWVRLMPRLLALALKEDFVMKALVGFAAFHLACDREHEEFVCVDETEQHIYISEMQQFAQHYRIAAYERIVQILSTLSLGIEDGDSLLAGLLLLSWQAGSWQTWNHLQANIQMVMTAVNPAALAVSELAKAAATMEYTGPPIEHSSLLHF